MEKLNIRVNNTKKSPKGAAGVFAITSLAAKHRSLLGKLFRVSNSLYTFQGYEDSEFYDVTVSFLTKRAKEAFLKDLNRKIENGLPVISIK